MEAAGVLEPGLTAQDLRVLRAVPSGATQPAATVQGIYETVNWRTQRGLRTEEIVDTLRGLEHLGYVAYRKGVYWRTSKGAQALD